ncbi:unnamed protein product [Cylicocyclus nassatus]|uniref:Uncharacterized protein n=1 Tax=Cylicocyclus nassatus TaxID=53992 RepID=A0AA36MG61_CYLNA|nr:unnamed protein product [Cylicocyclus nassatus]
MFKCRDPVNREEGCDWRFLDEKSLFRLRRQRYSDFCSFAIIKPFCQNEFENEQKPAMMGMVLLRLLTLASVKKR